MKYSHVFLDEKGGFPPKKNNSIIFFITTTNKQTNKKIHRIGQFQLNAMIRSVIKSKKRTSFKEYSIADVTNRAVPSCEMGLIPNPRKHDIKLLLKKRIVVAVVDDW
jgi:hypothetical protein